MIIHHYEDPQNPSYEPGYRSQSTCLRFGPLSERRPPSDRPAVSLFVTPVAKDVTCPFCKAKLSKGNK